MCNLKSIKNIYLKKDLVVAGGGLAGCCAAIAAARHGAKAALIQNRPVLGGNASSEVGLIIASADRDFRHARETGIIEEINLENRFRNHEALYANYNLDIVLWTLVKDAGVDLFLNTNIDSLEMESAHKINSLSAVQLGTEKRFNIKAPLFVDATGDGIVADLSGAKFMRGSEARSEYNESLAPLKASAVTQGSTLMFRTKNMGRPIPFVRPHWAYHFPNPEDLPRKVGPTEGGYLWIEYGAHLDTISDNEEIRDELWKILYGVWDHLKNHGDYGMENMEMCWVATWPGKRESRRVLGDYLLTQKDLTQPTEFKDAVAYGGWPCDVHNPDGFWAKEKWLNYLHLPAPYPIPYRCYTSKTISNLFTAGRLISATHIAHGSTRVMATCAAGGQAVGTAAALAIKYKKSPRQIGIDHIKELQQQLLKDDCYIPGQKNEDENDLARKAKVSSPSEYTDDKGFLYKADYVISGVSRGSENCDALWISRQKNKKAPPEILFQWDAPVKISSVQITFDTMIREQRFFDRPLLGALATCVRAYRILSKNENDDWIEIAKKTGNHLRHNVLNFPEIKTQSLKICIDETNGDNLARVYEVRFYKNLSPLLQKK